MNRFLYDIFHTRFGWVGILYTINGLRFCVLKQTALQTLEAIKTEASGSYLAASSETDVKGILQRYMLGAEDNLRLITIDINVQSTFYLDAWEVCRNIPSGQTRTYAWVASKIGRPKSQRAVGRAMASNPIPIVIPCHRVIRSDGSVGGYSGGGPDIKKKLLTLEREMEANDYSSPLR